MSKESRAIRHLEQNADRGDISAMFQLYQYYSNENNTNSDLFQNSQDEYLNKCIEFLESVDSNGNPIHRFFIRKVDLFEFKKFKSFTVDLESNLTVLIGNNGAGKSSILDSISKTLSWINAGLETEGKNGKPITYSDINNSSEHYGAIDTFFNFGGNSFFKGSLSKAIQGASEKKDSKVSDLKLLADIWRKTNNVNIINLPLFAFYSVERSNIKITKTAPSKKSSYEQRIKRYDAYTDVLEGGGRFDHFVDWFVGLHKKIEGYNTEPLKKLEQKINVLSEIVSDQTDHPLNSVLDELKEDYLELQSQDIMAEEVEGSLRYYKLVEEAITSAVPYVSEIYVDTSSGDDEIFVTVNNIKVKLGQLSDGQRIFVALIADLARRLVMLNPNLENPLFGQGIVLIDEIELHLHPLWQQQIVLKLQETFPNIQFILTTHSPQVLSTVDRKCIRILDKVEGKAVSPFFQTKGVISSDILEQIMETSSIPDVQEACWINEAIVLIEENSFEEDYFINLFNRLVNHFGAEHPEIIRLNSNIRLQQLKSQFNKKNRDEE